MRHYFVFYLFLFFCSISYSQDTVKVEQIISPEEQAQLDYNQGIEAAKTNHYEVAAELFSKSLLINPKFEKALFNRSIVYYKLNKHNEALNDINEALKLNPSNPEFYYNKSLIFYSIHQKDSQNLALDNCLKLNGTHSDAAYYKGINCFQENDISRAIGFYSVSLINKPDFAFALNDIGSCWRLKQHVDSAIYFYLKAIKANPNLSFVHNNLGSCYFAKKEYAKAIEAYTKAYELDKKNFNALLNRGSAYFESDNLAAAKKDFEEIIAEMPGNSFAYNNLASIAIKNKDYKTAAQLAGRAIELDQNNGAAYYNRGIAHQMLKQEDACCADWKKAYQLGINAAKSIYFSTCSN